MTSSLGLASFAKSASCSVVVWYFATNDWMLLGSLVSSSRGCASWIKTSQPLQALMVASTGFVSPRDHDRAVRRFEAISVTLHRVFRNERGNPDLFVFIYDSGLDVVRVHFPPIRRATSVAHRSVGISACLDINPICFQNVLGHRLQSRGTTNFERHPPA
jgi:hypothetical protein